MGNPTIRFYLAAKYSYRETLLPVAAHLFMNGHIVKADWLMGGHDGQTQEEKIKYAQLDLDDIDACTHFAVFNFPLEEGPPEPSSGRMIEYGYALAKGKHCFSVGPAGSLFFTK